MKLEDYDYIMVFTSHYRALYIYDRLRVKKIKTKLVTAPNKINISCTQALKIKEDDKETIKLELERNNIFPTAVFKIIVDGNKEEYELIE
ncbi:hypothetical protein A500_09640 [Clostridium sartagoforme AAU1]|jgi:hypothetical protein|uniref:Putative Se/S carrier protein-like domain-containing protein n=1 Tax=Clostridium sartagoforme AAU1 TaxID=1202534 RepID=R9CEL4_9CLOT|nr:DUF3343 domain-containing protein [Clostridium sartagoforme]EOR25656.1 hypothetical protein A500_09640 [Clostridium sartagoforme AAU1]